jgi:formate hydrogenlyase subunit 3/multisubunit Na+/H+ antiporter MnhD subunit
MLAPLLQPIVIPLLAGFASLLLPSRWEQARGWLVVIASAATLLATLLLLGGEEQLARFGTLFLRVDGLSGFILVAAAAFATLISLYSLAYMKGRHGRPIYDACLLWSLSFSCGVLLADELIFLAVCWGLLAVMLYLMIGLAGRKARDASCKTLLIVGGSDALLLLGVAIFWGQQGSTRMDTDAANLVSALDYLGCVCFLAAAFAKAGVIPLHSWLPDCGERADAPVTAFLPASLDKLLGIYLLVRIVTDLFQITPGINAILKLLGALTIIGAVLMALVQHDLKRLLAFHAVSQVGYMVMGIGTGTTLGMAAGLFHMLNHAIYKSCLFLVAGVVEKKTGTVELDRLGGLATRLPLTFVACLIASLSISGIPPLNGFASKWMVYQAIIESGSGGESGLWTVWLTAAMLGSALTLASFVKVLHGVFLCKPSPQVRQQTIRSATWPMALPMALLAGVCVLFGVFAQAIPLRYLIQPALGESVVYSGTWLSGRAASLIVLAFLLGGIVYALTLRHGKLRRVPTYIGGERLEQTRITGVPEGTDRYVEVTGVDFYRTVEQLPVLKLLYGMANKRIFDIYQISGRVSLWFSNLLSAAHTGALPLYLIWFTVGMLAVLYVFMLGNP